MTQLYWSNILQKTLKQSVLAPGEVYYHDPFFIAAEYGSTDVLCLLLNIYNADPTQVEALDKRGYRLLELACQNAHINTVHFLIDSEPLLGDIRARNQCGDTALLSAATSFAQFRYEDWEDNDFCEEWIRDRFVRSEAWSEDESNRYRFQLPLRERTSNMAAG